MSDPGTDDYSQHHERSHGVRVKKKARSRANSDDEVRSDRISLPCYILT